jgi:capsular exopolysaccharide synthesis family protein
VIQITSPTDAEERSTVAAGLAIGLLPSGQSVLLVSADLRSDRLSRMLHVPTASGLVDALTDPTNIDFIVEPVPNSGGLWALPTGTVTPANAEILASPLAKDLFRELRDRFDVIIVDGPPVLGNADSAVLAGLCDTTIVVVEASSSRRRDIARALDDLTLVGAEVTGVIMTEVGRAESVD